ncbi:MAG TPA: hypothetical protein VMV46_06325 [Thermoanaerobaculia bacterium]|nr:hypothetical protein [Thermoanaerobaculia bacterium]
MALATGGPVTVKERAGARRRQAAEAYALPDLLLYCLRGHGAWIFWITVAMVLLLRFFLLAAALAPPVQQLLPLALSLGLAVLLLWSVPPELARIVRATVAGRDELPDWGPLHDFGERQREIMALLLAALVGFGPALLALRTLGCATSGRLAPTCWTAAAVALAVGVGLGSLGFGAFAMFERVTLVLRVDLHVRLLATLGRRVGATAAGIGAGVVAALALGRLLGAVPWAGGVAQSVLLVWVVFTGGHAVGALIRRSPATFEAIYG